MVAGVYGWLDDKRRAMNETPKRLIQSFKIKFTFIVQSRNWLIKHLEFLKLEQKKLPIILGHLA